MLIIPSMRRFFDRLHVIKNRSPKIRYWKELERSQYLPEVVLRERQWKRFRDILAFAYENNMFYRKRFKMAGITPDDIRSSEDVKKIPFLTKQDIRQNADKMISNGYSRDLLLKAKTGGSTGVPLEIFVSVNCNEKRNACARRHDRWTGWEVGEPVGAVWGNPFLPRTLKQKLKNKLLFPQIYLDTMNISESSVIQFAKDWKKINPALLFGHAHSLYILAGYVSDLNLSCIQPKSILSTSMMLLPHERKKIESVFNVKVFDRYGCEEVGLIASECERHEGLHLNIEHLYIEFLKEDGTDAESGEPGKIVLTDLMNRAMPLIRYQVEDMGIALNKTCSCGRGLPLMGKVTGRTADFLIKNDGTKVAGVSLIENTLTRIPGIEQMQIIQNSLNSIILKIVPGYLYNKKTENELLDYFCKLFGADIILNIEHVDQITPEKSGKFRFCICNVKK